MAISHGYLSIFVQLFFFILFFHVDFMMKAFQLISHESGVSICFRYWLSPSSGVHMKCHALTYICTVEFLSLMHTTERMVCGIRCSLMSPPRMEY
jgi:hypothetical protein